MQLRALVINDIDYWQDELRDIIEDKDICCEVAQTLEEAKRLFRERHGDYDMIFLDGDVDDPDQLSSMEKTCKFLKWLRARGFRGLTIANSTRYNQRLLEMGCTHHSHPSNTPEDLDRLIKIAKRKRRKEGSFFGRMRRAVGT